MTNVDPFESAFRSAAKEVYAYRSLELERTVGKGLGHIIGLGETVGGGLLRVAAAVSSVTDGIPLAAMLAKILSTAPGVAGNPESPFWWSVVFGPNLGRNLTPIGSPSSRVLSP